MWERNKMKRKKFIRLLMANGYQRNQAAKIANEAMDGYKTSYKGIWENPMFRLEMVFFPKVCAAFAALGVAAVAVANALARYDSIVLKVTQEYPYSAAYVNAEYNRVKDMKNPEEKLRQILDSRLAQGY